MPKGLKRLLAALVLLFAVIAAWGIAVRLHARAALEKRAQETGVTLVAVTRVRAGTGGDNLVLPGTVQAYADAPVYARTTGYLKRWYVDIGARVREGQLLAEIDTPEVDQELRQAQADLATAEANERLAHTTNERWRSLLATQAVSRQDADEKAGDFAAKHALTASARANLLRLRDLRDFQRVVAPFDGTITARSTDIGHLITSNAPLFSIADARRLRIYVQVPQPFARSMQPGLMGEMQFADKPGRWPATVVRTADALDPATRTLQTELQVDNAQGELLPGSYADVHFSLPGVSGTPRIPSSAFIFRGSGLFVATVGADNRARLRPIQPGRDFGTEIEVVSGVSPGDEIIVNPPDSLVDNQPVRIAGGQTPVSATARR
ncbi:efflux RND transporter periplasmic adaptor subunit [Massilia horti]|uniref:Efflux RND transporter periplasmic adaptor subunit n=1 Tax=Massilia horti TaxID=2562153 RepID=A0A4Y9T3L0_9BURK|nr:efflux RND transporter periplasmic adaptor subunit [Massilia horti]TFW31630.1 efflux RND transporter periplasmic adaptor subunit [Massilia horti]